MAIDDPYNIGPLKRIINCNFEQRIQNGLVYPDNLNPVVKNRLHEVYERDQGLINSDLLAPITLTKAPGKFTGEMRKVVQAIISQGQPCSFDYKASLSHGIYTAADNSKWVIQISSDGVIAAPLPKRSLTDIEHAWLGYTPYNNDKLFDPSNTEIVILSNSASVLGFYSKTPFFNSCGWAFNSLGSNISNTCYNIDANGNHVGYLYTITIVGDANSPVSATISLDESGPFKLPRIRGFKIPNDTETAVKTFICDTGIEINGEAPIYAFYDNDLIKVVRAYSTPSGTVDHVDSLPAGGWTSYTLPFLRYLYQYNMSYKTGGSTVENSSGTYIDDFSTVSNIESGAMQSYDYIQKSKAGWVAYHGATFYNFNYYLSVERNVRTGISENNLTFCIIPLGDRESVYQLITNNTTSVSWNYNFAVNNARTPEVSCYTTARLVDGVECRRVVAVNTGSTTSLSQQDIFIIHPPVEMGDIICDTTPIQNDVSNTILDKSGLAEKSGKLYIVGSGGINDLVFDDATMDEVNVYTNESNDDLMYMYKDSASGVYFCSSEMNGISGDKYHISQSFDLLTYPVTSFSSGFNRLWFGLP